MPTYTCPTCTATHRLGADCPKHKPHRAEFKPGLYLYLSGPMTGLPQLNKPAFAHKATWLRMHGLRVLNPATLDGPEDQGDNRWDFYLRRDLTCMLHFSCNGVAVMDGWESSRGAVLECAVAAALGWPIRTVGDWLGDRDVRVSPFKIFALAFGHFSGLKQALQQRKAA